MTALSVRPGSPSALIDTDDGIVVTGAAPGAEVVLRSEIALAGQEWSCEAVYAADADGRVDTARDRADDGSLDPFRLYWSADLTSPLNTTGADPMRVTCGVESGRKRVEASWTRRWSPPGTTESDWAGEGVAGVLVRPPGDGPAPGVVLIPGSGGGLGDLAVARLLAGHGVATLAVATWGLPGLPDAMLDIDMEVVGAAARHLRMQGPTSITTVGVSRGGELALLAAAFLPDDVDASVSVVGSAVAWGAFGKDVDVNLPAWRFRGEPVPKVWEDVDDPYAVLDDPDRLEDAEIPVERTRGRVLLLTGEADAMWPATRLSDIAVRRAQRLGAVDRVEHVSYPDAGHLAAVPPGFAVPAQIVHPVDGSTTPFGGSRVGNQAARRDSWRRLRAFVGV